MYWMEENDTIDDCGVRIALILYNFYINCLKFDGLSIFFNGFD